MKLLIVVGVIVGLAALNINAQEEESVAAAKCVKEICPDFEKYKCCGSCVQQTCALEDDSTCPDVCVKGCYCIKGYVRSYAPDGRCIPIKKCPRTIPTLPPSK
ncbi:AGAP002445-PA-like protein [Anopheles sinensis]|uniref:AGAP002445-PA-like protein n=1 Tax=Anopheles sinensis TaxID=74873 RepID=A0A084WQ48_ANOSI|nr:AGAP002445-PA-like protein [Anopheles sinensis]